GRTPNQAGPRHGIRGQEGRRMELQQGSTGGYREHRQRHLDYAGDRSVDHVAVSRAVPCLFWRMRSKYELAKALRLTVAPSLLARTDEVIKCGGGSSLRSFVVWR